MKGIILAPLALRQDPQYLDYFAILSANAQWAERARTPVLFADLPTNAVEGWQAPITDSMTAVPGAVITGGGGNHVLGYFNGTNWLVAS